MNGSIDATATGNSQRQIVENLGGSGALLFSDGVIKGINIAAMLRNAAGAFDAANRGEAQQTDFAALGGTFRIQSGVLVPVEIGRAHVCTPVPNAHLVCRLLLEKPN